MPILVSKTTLRQNKKTKIYLIRLDKRSKL